MNEKIHAHYARADLGNIILSALEKAGKDLDQLTPEDLAPIDEFHIRGRAATLELARAVASAPRSACSTWAAAWAGRRGVSPGNSDAASRAST